MLKFRLIILIFLLGLATLNTQIIGQTEDFQITHYNHRNGLPGHLVVGVSQDNSGLIWMTTENGLVRFDGYEFVPFNNFEYSRQIEGTQFQMDVTRNQSDVLAIYHGQDSLSFELFDLQTLKGKELHFETFENAPISIFTRKKGHSFLIFEKGDELSINRLEETEQLKELFSLPILDESTKKTISLFVDNAGDFWILQANLLTIYDASGNLKKQFSHQDFGVDPTNMELVFIYQDQQARIWLALKEEKGVYQYNAERQTFQKEKLGGKSDFFSNVWEDVN